MKVDVIPAARLPEVWSIADAWIAEACARPGCDVTAQDLCVLCAKGEAHLVLIGEPNEPPVAAGVLQIRNHESGTRSCWVYAVGGKGARAWRTTLRLIERGAEAAGCHLVEFVGRPGWAGLLPDYVAQTHYEKRLGGRP